MEKRIPKKLVLDDSTLNDFENSLDANERRIRDAECLGMIMQYANPSIVLEIGTATGRTTALLAKNASNAHIHTLNILPEEISAGEGGCPYHGCF